MAPPRAHRPLELSRVLALKAGLRVERLGDGPTFLLGERERFVAPGAGAAEVLALVDGQRTVHDVVRAASPRVSEPEALYALTRLVAAGHLVTATPDLPADRAAFWHGVGLDARAATDALARTPVSVRALGDSVPIAWLSEAIEQAGVLVDRDADVLAVLTDDPLHPELAAINDRALRRGTPWCLLKPAGIMPLVGPIFFRQTALVYVLYIIVALVAWALYRTRWGLRVRAVGEHPKAADTVGIKVNRTRYRTILLAGAIAGLGGAYFSLVSVAGFNREMTGGAGYIALAAVIFGKWDPIRATLAALLFGFATNLQGVLSAIGAPVPTQFMLMLPYLVTIFAVAGLVGRSRPPAADGVPYKQQ